MTTTKNVPAVKIFGPRDWRDEWLVTGDLFGYEGAESTENNNEVEELVKMNCEVDGIQWDSESGQFFAYADSKESAIALFLHMKTIFKTLIVEEMD